MRPQVIKAWAKFKSTGKYCMWHIPITEVMAVLVQEGKVCIKVKNLDGVVYAENLKEGDLDHIFDIIN